MRTKKEIRQELKDLFENDDTLFNETIEELDSYNGYLGDDRYYSMEYLTDYIDTSDLWNSLIYRMFYGSDDDCYITNSQGEKEYQQFNPNREYYNYEGCVPDIDEEPESTLLFVFEPNFLKKLTGGLNND